MVRSSIDSWGPSAWTFLHTVSFSYSQDPTDKEREDTFDFMHKFAAVIPCKRCRTDWINYLQTNLATSRSKALDNRTNFSMFVVDGHNYVNAKLGKPMIQYEKVRQWYEPAYAKLPNERQKYNCFYFGIVGTIILVAVGCIILRQHEKPRANHQRESYRLG